MDGRVWLEKSRMFPNEPDLPFISQIKQQANEEPIRDKFPVMSLNGFLVQRSHLLYST